MDLTLEGVTTEALNDITLMISPCDADLDFLSWIKANRERINQLLSNNPSLLFRNFVNIDAERFSVFSSLFAEPIDYVYRSTPRTEVSKGVYTATEYPSEFTIPQHCENAYQNSWPLRLYFHCVQSAARGGETPLSDVRKVTESIPEAVKEKFKAHGVMYVRNYSPGIDIPWQTVFQTQEKSVVEQYCREYSIECEWTGEDSLRTRQVCQALARHPVTDEELWFNQAHLFHVSNLDPSIQDYLLSKYSEQELPRNAYYGNGDPIANGDLEQVRRIFEAYKDHFAWQEGDTLLIDNMLCSHGRNPFTGKRKVLVSMNTPTFMRDIPSSGGNKGIVLALRQV